MYVRFQVDLVQYVNNIFNGTGISITKEEPILVDTVEYFDKLNGVIKKTTKRHGKFIVSFFQVFIFFLLFYLLVKLAGFHHV